MTALDTVITSMAVLTSVGDTVEEFGAALRDGRGGVRAVPLPDAARVTVAAFLPDSAESPERVLTGLATRPTRAAVRVAREAVAGAGLGPSALCRTAVVIGGNNLALDYQAAAAVRMGCGDGQVQPSHALAHLDIDAVGAVSEATGATAEGCTIGGSSASGALALIHACRLLTLDAADHCLVVGALSELSTAEYRALTDTGALAAGAGMVPASVCRPFDSSRCGFVHGHGSAAVVVERADTARARGARQLAGIAGFAQRLDGKRGTRPSADGQTATIQAALRSAGLRPADVDYVNAHATGSKQGDSTEAESLARTFGDGPLVNATKELTGHCLSGSGVIEAVATVIQLRDGFCHPNPNLRSPADSRLNYAGPKAVDTPLRVALSTSFAFSGINTAIVLTRSVQDD